MGPFGNSGGRSSGLRVIPLVLFALYGIYYYLSNRETVPLTGRRQLVEISRDQEAALGLQSYRQILRQENVVTTGQNAERVKEIGRRISAVAEDPGFQWDYNLIESSQVNAFCLPGGKVAVYTGILPVAKNADGLAVVMGHEIAHAIARHGAERMAHQKLVQIGTMAAGVAISEMDPQQQRAVMGALGVGAQFGVLLPFSREHESEADYMGLIYVARACFDPTEAPRLWERMAQASGGRGHAQFMSTHPSNETRIRQFQQWMPEALKIKREKCGA
ncbi:MAG: M48 family metallopeptidase [Acidobacteria bacterium]|nr:M48 family metallopeptidase [Acidobacteriota bacterium]